MADASGSAVFEHEIRVGWGDCDPARIAYTGRLPVFALEAIDAWWEHVLGGDGWYQLELDRGFGTPFVHLSLDFRAPVTPRHRLKCEVWPTRLGRTSISFRMASCVLRGISPACSPVRPPSTPANHRLKFAKSSNR